MDTSGGRQDLTWHAWLKLLLVRTCPSSVCTSRLYFLVAERQLHRTLTAYQLDERV
ncbi:MAG: hypothetical protein JWN63_3798 [Candidatus Acidoferrum typicum]|jgi:hypothetical protein|nr:hypothetical protein [Candidatus Acidoferrum typicum]